MIRKFKQWLQLQLSISFY